MDIWPPMCDPSAIDERTHRNEHHSLSTHI